jgi:hypothetical protein
VDLALEGSLAMFADCAIERLVGEEGERAVLVGEREALVVGGEGALAGMVV